MIDDIDSALLERIATIVGNKGIITEADDLAPHLTEWRGLFQGRAAVMVAPAGVSEVADVLRLCQEHGIGVVPQGGNTGLVGGGIPHSSPEAPQILLSSLRMNAIRAIDAENYTITVESGCLLADVQAAAERADRLFPLSLAAEGSCHLGGNISTNAGGINVLRYGSMRNLVLGLEVVLPDGRVFEGLRGLRKDNTGYDLKQLFIGAEGTLGFVTAATCKLFPQPASIATAFTAVADPESAIRLHSASRAALGDQLVAFELINRTAMDLVLEHIPATRNPLSASSEWYVLLELESAATDQSADDSLEVFLAAGMQDGLLQDAALAQTGAHRDAFWHLRHSISEAEKLAGAGIKNDISVPLSRMAEFLSAGGQLMSDHAPGARIVAFGHLGDGNLHFNLAQPPGTDPEDFMALRETVSQAINTIAVGLGGSFSAEHGIGSLKCDELARLSGDVELDLMRAVKNAIDPAGIMNPGKIFPIIDA